jgi:hypothetical protein
MTMRAGVTRSIGFRNPQRSGYPRDFAILGFPSGGKSLPDKRR